MLGFVVLDKIILACLKINITLKGKISWPSPVIGHEWLKVK